MAILIGFLIFAVILVFSAEVSSRLVYGKTIPEKELDIFFEKYLANYEINDLSKRPLFMGYVNDGEQRWLLPYAAKLTHTPSSSWYISEYGMIPRWSKWPAKLEAHYQKLESEGNGYKPKPPLSSLAGFTLIEVLVVIGIVAILASVVIVALNPAARDFANKSPEEQKKYCLEKGEYRAVNDLPAVCQRYFK